MSWNQMCWSKEFGGLNFHDLELFNKVLLAKQLWWLIHPPNLLVAKVMVFMALSAPYWKQTMGLILLIFGGVWFGAEICSNWGCGMWWGVEQPLSFLKTHGS